MGMRRTGCCLYLGIGGVRHTIGNIVADAVVEEESGLCHYSDMPPQRGDAV